MKYSKGKSGNPTGRPKGALNKTSSEQRDYLRDFLLENKLSFELHVKKLNAKDFVHTYIALMQYVVPRPATADLKEVPQLEAFIAMSKEERQALIEEIREELKSKK